MPVLPLCLFNETDNYAIAYTPEQSMMLLSLNEALDENYQAVTVA